MAHDCAARAAALALCTDGLVSRATLSAAGLDPRLMDRECAAGRWKRVLPGVAHVGSGPLRPQQRYRAALLWAGETALLTGQVGCDLWGLSDPLTASTVDVLLPMPTRRQPPPWVRVRRTGRLEQAWERGGLPVAGLERCVVDASRRAGGLRDVRALVLASLLDGRCSVTGLEVVLAETGSGGSAWCRRALADARRGAWSAPEAEMADVLDGEPALPPYLLNPELRLDGRLLGRPDGWFPGRGIGWEVDSRRHHGGVDDVDATLLRHRRFADAGLELIHLTPSRIRLYPDQVLDDVCRRVLRPRPPEPPGLVVVPFLRP